MSRTFAPIESNLLKDKIIDALKKHEHLEDRPEKVVFENDFGYQCLRCFSTLTPTIEKDIKVRFDLENVLGAYDGPNRDFDPPHGFNTFDNGFTFYGMSAGGDWEYPVYFVIYWDGSKLRAYVPTDGNPWNTDTKEAYGNDDKKDAINFRKRYPEFEMNKGAFDTIADCVEAERELILTDIAKRIVAK